MLMKVKEVTTKEVEEETIKYNLEVEEDNSYVVDFIGHNSNRNSDYFPEKALKEYHKTFERLQTFTDIIETNPNAVTRYTVKFYSLIIMKKCIEWN
jgi:hypothetical protein